MYNTFISCLHYLRAILKYLKSEIVKDSHPKRRNKILLINIKIFRTYRPKIAYSLLAIFWLILSVVLGYKPITEYFDTGLVPRIPSLIAAVGALVVSVQLWNTGMILERVNVAHLSQVRHNYKMGNRKNS